ncbi:hypothetical protein ABE945_11480, partial [Enterococcus gilvus]
MKKKGLFLLLFTYFILFNVENVRADSVQASNIGELENLVNNATEARTIVLSSDFPTIINKSITLKENSNSPIIIDGQQKILTPDGVNPIISYGGGGASSDASLTIKNMFFQGNGAHSRALYTNGYKGNLALENVSVSDFHADDDGGAMYVQGNTSIRNSTFKNNSSNAPGYSGGAIGGKGFSSSLIIENSTFENNKTLALGTGPVGGEGGAIYMYAPSSSAIFHFKNNYFKENSAVENASGNGATLADGGAIAFFNVLPGVDIQFDGNTFDRNIAGDNGGAILIQTNDTINEGILFKNNTFFRNVAQGTSTPTESGGAIQIYTNGGRSTFRKTYVDFVNNTFVANEAKTSGGAIGFAGAPYFNTSSGRFSNNIFVDNKASTSKYNAVAGSVSTPKNQNNLGFDNGTNNTISANDVFGTLPYDLVKNYTTIMAGSSDSREYVPTLPIAPEKKANKKVAAGPDNLNVDQRSEIREIPSDIGSVEISWIKYDSNGGNFTFTSLPSVYDGTEYYESLKPSEYYQVGTNPSSKTIPSGINDLGITRSGWTFLGWSKDKDAKSPDEKFIENTTITLKSNDVDSLYDDTLYAVWKKE